MVGSGFKSKTDKYFATHKMVGVYIPLERANHLSLHCMLNGITRTKIIESLIEKHIEKDLMKADILLLKVCKKALRDWERFSEENVHEKNIGWKNVQDVSRRWEEYKRELTTDLKKHKISVLHIKEVIEYIEANSI